ncbi:ankyrin repeat domain-containing protein 54-like [Schistocerca piceifrons]|uniref:ankyrin repeat domain-containing protein 54-like n=1 Tax=Schistocerca piceifrons TaxID=274613 RepID=UPI001F5EEC28|nr:ankyrin repeat domain-containing protein 54-like [Schistocerca piceifrons]
MSAVTEVQNTTTEALAALLDGGDGALVTLVAGETRVAAHRAVLAAASPVFKAMFRDDMPEASCGQVRVDDVEGPDLRLLVAYTYTLQAPQLPDTAPQLLAAAEKYGLSALKAACERQLISQLGVETAVATAVRAVRHSCPDATRAAVAFIKDHLQVMATRGWADAVLEYPQEVNEVIRLLREPPAEASSPTATGGGSTPNSDRQPHSGHSQTPAAAAPPTSARHTPPPEDAAVSRFRSPTATGGGSTPNSDRQPHSGHSRTPAAAAPPTSARHTPPPEDAAVSRFRSLPEEKRGGRLIKAAKKGAVKEVRLLLAAGVDVGARGWGRWTALHWAARRGRAAVVRLLLSAASDPNARDRWGQTPLHFAASCGHAKAAAALVRAGADRGATDEWGRTPLDIATRQNNQKLIEMLPVEEMS